MEETNGPVCGRRARERRVRVQLRATQKVGRDVVDPGDMLGPKADVVEHACRAKEAKKAQKLRLSRATPVDDVDVSDVVGDQKKVPVPYKWRV